jgi:hypothetical protein
MSQSKLKGGRTNWMRTPTCVSLIALLTAVGAGPVAAADFEKGEFKTHVDTTLSAGISMRVQDRDCELIFRGNGGCQDDIAFTNFDDGDLNYDKWDVFSNMYKATVDVEMSWRNFGGFVRGSFFYDLRTMEIGTDRTALDQDTLYHTSALNGGVVGAGYQLLDAYVYGNFEVLGRPLDVRVGNQLLNWGESLFYQGVNSTNTADLTRLRAPGSQIKEALLPAPLLRVSTELFRNLGIEAYYQMYWNYTQLDPVGSYFSDNDMLGRGAEGFFITNDPGSSGKTKEELFAENRALEDLPPVALEGGTDVQLLRPPTGDPFFDLLLQALMASDPSLNPRVETQIPPIPVIPFFPQGLPRLKDERPDSQGQWGVALRYFAEPIRTEFGAYYLRIHDKAPSVGFVFEPQELGQLVLQPTYMDLGPLLPLLPPIPTVVRPLGRSAYPIGYFREYPENINVFGVSASTEFFGVAWGAEVSYKNRQPVPILTAFTDAMEQATDTGRRATVSGYDRENRIQAQINAIATIGPGDPVVGAIVRALHISSLAATLEVAMVDFPSLDDDVVYAPPNGDSKVNEFSIGYTMLIQGDYDNPLGIPITLTPRLSFSHDVEGNTPGRNPFIEDRKSFSAGLNLDYLGVWQFDLAYTNFFGAGIANGASDRDFVSLSVTRSF